jgi:hypothetical protein
VTSPLLISVPVTELGTLPPCGSLFDARRLLGAHITTPLYRALRLVFEALAPSYNGVLCVARPEMFTHGESLAWLQGRIEGARDHLCLSNGHVLKTLPGVRNHLFMYGLEDQTANVSFRTLLRRAPEQLDAFEEQLNSSHVSKRSSGQMPNPRSLGPGQPIPARGLISYHPFYRNRHSHEDSAERMLAWGSHNLPSMSEYQQAIVVLCTDAGLHDENFCRALGRLVADASRRKDLAVVLRLPDLDLPEATTTARMDRLLSGISRSEVSIPRVRMLQVILTTDLDEAAFADLGVPYELVVHDTFPFWSQTRKFYARAADIHVYLSRVPFGRRREALTIQNDLLGRTSKLHRWTSELAAAIGVE